MHPETTNKITINEFLAPLISAIEAYPETPVIITKSNADAGGREINFLFEKLSNKYPSRIRLISNLGQNAYVCALENAKIVIGNSSSGILEAPAAGTPTVNIGDRQKGRLRSESVIDTKNDFESIMNAIDLATSKPFQQKSQNKITPYGTAGASQKIFEILRDINIDKLLPKSFVDLENSK
jgi:UDP-N-acetylglucosamine 2-epimerase (non-hydrolysing)/GDP/UDP-N,N'-diacetylbacillosamine 2-epimerase (hydrolysing)